jgi:hypothetical protein
MMPGFIFEVSTVFGSGPFEDCSGCLRPPSFKLYLSLFAIFLREAAMLQAIAIK